MALSPNFNQRFFPSYAEIHQKILTQHKKNHASKLAQLQHKITAMKQTFNLEEEHAQIRRNLLQNYRASNHQYLQSIAQNDGQEKLQKQKQSQLWNTPIGNSASNMYSLNYCIDDDLEEDNHYENHLKFKKQVLERDLFENVNYKPDKKKKHDEQYIFKNLYNPRPATAIELGISEKLKVRKPLKKNYLASENTKQFKENIQQFQKKHPVPSAPKKAGLKSLGRSKQTELKSRKRIEESAKKCLRKQASQDQFTEHNEVCQKNAKILKDSYGKYLRELSGTNIIKWRVLGGEKKEEKDFVLISVKEAGIRVSAVNEGHGEKSQ